MKRCEIADRDVDDSKEHGEAMAKGKFNMIESVGNTKLFNGRSSPIKKQPLISLVMIVKNEEKVLESCIRSVSDIVDEFKICDTGSTDKTKDIIKCWGEVIEIPYEGDVKTKQEALKHATLKYVLMMDADETVVCGLTKLRKYAEANIDCVSCKINDYNNREEITNIYNRVRLFRNDGSWSYNGPGTHGSISGKGVMINDNFIKIRHSHAHKINSKDNGKIDRILPFLEEAVTTNNEDKRGWFYLARTYKDMKLYEKAIVCYNKYLSIETYYYADECWQAHYDIALCELMLSKKPNVDELLKMSPRRAEGYNLLGKYYYFNKEYDKAIKFFEMSINYCEIDEKITLFLNPKEYFEEPADYLSTCYWKIGEVKKAKNLTEELITKISYVDQRLLDNLHFYKEALNASS